MCSTSYLCQNSIKLEFSRRIFITIRPEVSELFCSGEANGRFSQSSGQA